VFRKISLKLVSTFLIISLLAPLSVYSQEPNQIGFSISPYSYEYELKAGQEVTATLKVENINKTDITVSVEPENLVAYGQDGQVSITDEEPSFSIKSWIKVTNSSATIKPKEFGYFDFKISVPLDAEPGSHYGALSVRFVGNENPLNGSGASIVQKSSAIILLRVPGDVKEELNLVYFQPEKFFYSEPKFKLSALFENKGTVNVKPSGEINIFDIWGNKVKTIKVVGKNILPDKKRIFEEEFDMEDISYFRAELNMFYGSTSQKTIFAQTNFIGINLPVLSKYLLIISGILVFYFIFRRRINKAIKILLKGDK